MPSQPDNNLWPVWLQNTASMILIIPIISGALQKEWPDILDISWKFNLTV